jgi:nucleoid DNA-binding protein
MYLEHMTSTQRSLKLITVKGLVYNVVSLLVVNIHKGQQLYYHKMAAFTANEQAASNGRLYKYAAGFAVRQSILVYFVSI